MAITDNFLTKKKLATVLKLIQKFKPGSKNPKSDIDTPLNESLFFEGQNGKYRPRRQDSLSIHSLAEHQMTAQELAILRRVLHGGAQTLINGQIAPFFGELRQYRKSIDVRIILIRDWISKTRLTPISSFHSGSEPYDFVTIIGLTYPAYLGANLLLRYASRDNLGLALPAQEINQGYSLRNTNTQHAISEVNLLGTRGMWRWALIYAIGPLVDD